MANKVKETIWFSPMGGLLGIAMTENERKERKCYVKAVTGIDEKQDAREIADYGAKITLTMAKSLVAWLEKK